MSLRRVVEDLLGADGGGTDGVAPGADRSAAALEAAGHGALEPELYGEALVHFADTAPLEQADALAAVVVEASAVPLDPDLDPLVEAGATTNDGTAGPDDAGDPDDVGDPDVGDSDPDALDADAIHAADPTVDDATPLDEPPDAAPLGADDSPRPAEGFGAGAVDEPAVAVDDPTVGDGDIGVGGDLGEPMLLDDGSDSGGLAPAPDPLDPFDLAAADSTDGADLGAALDRLDESRDASGDADPDLLLDD